MWKNMVQFILIESTHKNTANILSLFMVHGREFACIMSDVWNMSFLFLGFSQTLLLLDIG